MPLRPDQHLAHYRLMVQLADDAHRMQVVVNWNTELARRLSRP